MIVNVLIEDRVDGFFYSLNKKKGTVSILRRNDNWDGIVPKKLNIDGVDYIVDTLKGIPYYGFYEHDRSNPITVKIPETITNINSAAFDYAEDVKAIVVDKNNPKYKSIDGVLFDKAGKKIIAYPKRKKDTEYTIPSGVERANFTYNYVIKKINLPESFKSMDELRDLDALRSVCVQSVKRGTKLKNGAMKSTIKVGNAKQIKKPAKNVTIKTVVNNAKGKKVFTVTANAKKMKAGNSLYILKNGKNGKHILVNANKYKVTKNGSVTVSLKGKGDFVLVTKTVKNKSVAAIKKTIAPAEKTKSLSKGKTAIMTLKNTLDKANVKSISYTTTDKSVATVNKNGKIKAKKKGSATIKAIVTLKDGSRKIVSMKIKIK